MLRSIAAVAALLVHAWQYRCFDYVLKATFPTFQARQILGPEDYAREAARILGPPLLNLISPVDKLKWIDENSQWAFMRHELNRIFQKERRLDWAVTDADSRDPRIVSDLTVDDDDKEMVKSEMPDHNTAAMAIYVGDHDTHVAISKNGRLQCVLEFERLFDARYTGGSIDKECKDKNGKDWCLSNDTTFEKNLDLAFRTIKQRCDIDDGVFPDHFNSIISVGGLQFKSHVEKHFHSDNYFTHRHHWAHALMGFHASPFHSPLVISYDGSPADQFQVYRVTEGNLTYVANPRHRISEFYSVASTNLPLTELANEINKEKDYGNPGKFMGYAGVGKPELSLELLARDMMDEFLDGDVCPAFEDLGSLNRSHVRSQVTRWEKKNANIEFERAVAASVQSAWEKTLFCLVSRFLEAVGREHVDGVVLVGGGALNVMANQYVYDQITASHNIGVYVPPAPADNGLAVGALMTLNASMQIPNNWQYIGFRLWDEESLSNAALEWGAQQLSSIGGVDYLAELLAGGQPWLQQRTSNASRPIIAIVRGRQEYGPRALGHRSLVAVPDSENIRDRLNTLKYRAWWRPAAPMIADESLEEVFGRVVKSPYMTMAPKVRDEIREKFPAIAHFDGTARHQSVGHDDEPWIHALLMAVGERIGLAALINTSFNRKGRPIVNTVRESLAMLSEEKDLDYVVIEDFLFSKKAQ